MRRIMIPVLALTLAAAPAAVEAQTAPRGERAQMAARMGGMGNPAERVLRQREALGLTAAQVAQLEQLQAEFATRNAPLLEQLRAARPAAAERGQPTDEQRQQMRQRREQMAQMTPEQRQQLRDRMAQMTPEQRQQMRRKGQAAGASPEARARMETLRPVMTQLRQNHQDARQQVRAVLTAEQATRLQELAQRRDGRGRPDGARRGMRGPR
jgi:hypothetical protein